MGSEMCIRDRPQTDEGPPAPVAGGPSSVWGRASHRTVKKQSDESHRSDAVIGVSDIEKDCPMCPMCPTPFVFKADFWRIVSDSPIGVRRAGGGETFRAAQCQRPGRKPNTVSRGAGSKPHVSACPLKSQDLVFELARIDPQPRRFRVT